MIMDLTVIYKKIYIYLFDYNTDYEINQRVFMHNTFISVMPDKPVQCIV